jgi:hypothetical protein
MLCCFDGILQVDSELKHSVIKVAEAKVRGAKELSEVRRTRSGDG